MRGFFWKHSVYPQTHLVLQFIYFGDGVGGGPSDAYYLKLRIFLFLELLERTDVPAGTPHLLVQ